MNIDPFARRVATAVALSVLLGASSASTFSGNAKKEGAGRLASGRTSAPPAAPSAPSAAAPQEVQTFQVLFQDSPARRLGDTPITSDAGPARNEFIELKRIPLPGSTAGPGPAGPIIADTFIQSSPGPALSPTPQHGRNVLGIGSGLGNYVPRVAPPDPNGAAGPDHYVQWVNKHFAIFRKDTGQLVYGPAPGSTIWADFPGTCARTNDGDTIVKYDRIANRWVLTQFSVKGVELNDDGDIVRKLYRQCVAVSTTPDPTGTYHRYEFDYPDFNDYPKMAVWPDAYYISFNMFREIPDRPGRFTFLGSTVCAYDRQAMLREVNRPITQQCIAVGSFGGLQPADLDGATPPPAGSPGYFINFGVNSLNLWRFRADWSMPVSARTTRLSEPVSIPVARFDPACGGGACITQSSVNQTLDSLADRLMYRLSYRHFRRPDGTTDREVMLVNHSVAVGGNSSASRSGIRWYELRNQPGAGFSNSNPRVHQHGTFAPDVDHRWMGSIAMDKVGNIALGYSVSGGGLFPSLRYTGRLPNDPPGRMRGEVGIVAGTGSQESVSRWGDYTSMSVDPADDCTLWYTSQYLQGTDSFNWSTRIFSFRFPSCQ